MVFNNKVYDVLKWITQFMLPGLGTLYFALAKIWRFPYGEEVVGSIAAVTAFLGLLLGISTHNYKGDGVIEVDANRLTPNGEKIVDGEDSGVVINIPDHELLTRDRIVLNVTRLNKEED